MDKKDLKQIGEVVEKVINKGLGDFWQGNLEPSLDSLHSDIGEVDERLTIVERKLDKALYKETERITKLESEMKVVKEKLGIF